MAATINEVGKVKRVEFDLEEYRALRSEVIQSKDEGNKILAFGLAAVGIVLGAGLSNKDSQMGMIVLGFFLPVLSSLVLSLWFAAQERMARASHYLSGVEARIKSEFGDTEGVSWEAWLRARKPNRGSEHFWSTEKAGIALFVVIIASSILMGLTVGGSNLNWIIKGLVIGASIIICGALIINVFRRYKRWKLWLSTHYDPEVWETLL